MPSFAIVAVLALVSCAASAPLSTKTLHSYSWYVSVTGNNANDGHSPLSPLLDIQTALSRLQTDDDMIYIMPGQYTGPANTGLTFDRPITITAYQPQTGNNPVIRCTSNVGWTFSAAANVQDLHFVSCTTALSFSTQGSVDGCIIDAASAVGIFLASENATSLVVSNSEFNENDVSMEICPENGGCPDATVHISGVLVKPGSGKTYGIAIGNTTATITSSTLRDMYTSSSGPASNGKLLRFSAGQLTLTNTALINGNGFGTGGCFLQDGGGSSTITNVTFANCTVGGTTGGSSAYGGAVHCQSGLMVIKNSAFIGNKVGYADYAYGGGLYSSCSANIFDTAFTNNSVYAGAGGAYACSTQASVFVQNCTFANDTPDIQHGC